MFRCAPRILRAASTSVGSSVGAHDGIKLLQSQHQSLLDHVRRFRLLEHDDFKQKKHVVNSFAREWIKHNHLEENVVYPALRQLLHERGDKLADDGIDVHNTITETFVSLTKIHPDSSNIAKFNNDVIQLSDTMMKHIEVEEKDVFPWLRGSLNQDELVALFHTLNWHARFTPQKLPSLDPIHL